MLGLLGTVNQKQVESRAVFQCEEGGGLLVTFCDRIDIIGLTFVGCGMSSAQSVRKSSLTISLCSNVTLSESSVLNGTANGLVLENSVNFIITKCYFTGNAIQGLSISYSDAASMYLSDTKYSGQVINSVFAFSGVYELCMTFNQSEFFVEVVVNDAEFYTGPASSHISVETLSCFYAIEISNFLIVGGEIGVFVVQEDCLLGGSTPTIRFQQGELKDLSYCGITFTWLESVDGLLVLDSLVIHGIANDYVLGAVFIFQIPELTDDTKTGLTFHGRNLTFSEIHSFLPNSVLGNSATIFWIISVDDATLSDISVFNNTGSGLQLYGSVVFLTGDNTFYNNSGLNGGAMALYEGSVIILLPPAKVNYTLNRADIFGGAIYSSSQIWIGGDAEIFLYCFIQQAANAMIEEITIVFSQNEAGVAGSLVYGGDISECAPWINGAHISTNSIIVADDLPACGNSLLSSTARQVYLCQDICPEFAEVELQAVPGQSFSLTVVAVGQSNGSSPGVVQLASSNLIPSTTNYNISSQCTTLSQTLRLTEALDTVDISLSLADPSIPSLVNIPRVLLMRVLPCPPGFQFSMNRSGVCVCGQILAEVTTMCSIVNETVTALGNPWIAYDTTKQCITVVVNCPFDYCESDAVFNIVNSDQQCAKNRSGVLCGSCKEGLSLYFESDTCRNCSTEEAQWSVPVYVLTNSLLAVVVIALIAGLNLTVSTGSVNGPLFFISVVEIYERIFFPNDYVKILLNWFTLRTGLSGCFNGLNACGQSWVVIISSFILVLMVPCLMFLSACAHLRIFFRCPMVVKSCLYFVSGTVSKALGSRAVPVLATVFLISYTRLFLISIRALYSITLRCCDINGRNCSTSTVWYIDGSVQFLDGCHLFLFIASVIILIVFLIFTTLIVLLPCQERYISNIRIFQCYHALMKPWHDAYGGPYKDTYRSWTGILLLVRCILGLVVALVNDSAIALAVLSCTCLLITSFLIFFPVYKRAYLNSLELLSLGSLSTMSMLSAVESINSIYVYIIFILYNIAFLAIIMFHLYQRLLQCDWFHQMLSASKFLKILKQPHPNGMAEEHLDNKNSHLDDFSLEKLPTSIAATVPMTTVSLDSNSLREPQLDEISFDQQ